MLISVEVSYTVKDTLLSAVAVSYNFAEIQVLPAV